MSQLWRWTLLPLAWFSIILPLQAEVKCFPEAIKTIEVAEGGDLFYATASGVRRILTNMARNESQAMFDILKSSIGTDQIIQVIYPEDYDCKKPDLDVYAVRLKMIVPAVP